MVANDYELVDCNQTVSTSMPATFQLDCPHCGTARVGFELVNESWLARRGRWHVCAQCNHCVGLVVLNLVSYTDQENTPSNYYTSNPTWFEIEEMYPASVAGIPPHLPEEVGRLFRQGADNVPANPDAAGTMFRKTLEATLRDKCHAATGTLFERIDKAAELGVLTSDLARYAHTIRLEGNEAAHGTYDEAGAGQLHSLVTLVLNYVYTLPGMQAEIDAKARAAALAENAASGET